MMSGAVRWCLGMSWMFATCLQARRAASDDSCPRRVCARRISAYELSLLVLRGRQLRSQRRRARLLSEANPVAVCKQIVGPYRIRVTSQLPKAIFTTKWSKSSPQKTRTDPSAPLRLCRYAPGVTGSGELVQPIT